MRLVVLLVVLVAVRPPIAQETTLNNSKQLKNVKHVETAKVLPEVAPPQAAPPQAPVVPQAQAAPVAPPTVNLNDHQGLMSLAGISQNDWPAVDYIVSHESSWNPGATEPTTLAHGLVQALPYSKTGCGWDDAVCQLKWGQAYAVQRYGGWWAAQAYWSIHRNW